MTLTSISEDIITAMEVSKTAELVLSLEPVIISPLIYIDDQVTAELKQVNQAAEG